MERFVPLYLCLEKVFQHLFLKLNRCLKIWHYSACCGMKLTDQFCYKKYTISYEMTFSSHFLSAAFFSHSFHISLISLSFSLFHSLTIIAYASSTFLLYVTTLYRLLTCRRYTLNVADLVYYYIDATENADEKMQTRKCKRI